jgi:hypothetical protein
MVAANRAPPEITAFAVANRSHENEFNLLNPYLIVSQSRRLMFHLDE